MVAKSYGGSYFIISHILWFAECTYRCVFIVAYTCFLAGYALGQDHDHHYWRIDRDFRNVDCPCSTQCKNTNSVLFRCADRYHVYRNSIGLSLAGAYPFCRQCIFKNIPVTGITFSFELSSASSILPLSSATEQSGRKTKSSIVYPCC